jgi:hypothetical protein
MKRLVRLRSFARQNIFLTTVHTILRGRNPRDRIVQRGLTSICIEGYPRSGNSFAVRMFRTANHVHIGHHTHSTANVARAVRYGIPAVVLLRNPVDAITSFAVATRKVDIDDKLEYYLAFYQWVERRKDSVVIADFGVLISDFNDIIRQVNDKYDAGFNYIQDLSAATERAKRDIRQRFASQSESRRRRMWMAMPRDALFGIPSGQKQQKAETLAAIAGPSDEREQRAEELRALVVQHRRIREAKALHARLIHVN